MNKGWEIFAVVNSLIFTLLLTYNSLWCWLFSFIASATYLIICFRKKIYAESFLQLFYLGTTIYGFLNWGTGVAEQPQLLPFVQHLYWLLPGAALVVLSGYLLGKFTNAANFYVDSFTTIFSIIATLLMINLYPSNWLYFIVIDAVSVYLYLSRKMYYTALLFGLYSVLAINGWLQWTT